MFPLFALLGSAIKGVGSLGSAVGSGIGQAAGAAGSLLTKGGQAAGGGMSNVPAVAGESGLMGALRSFAGSTIPGSQQLLTKGNFMGNFQNMLKDPRFLNYIMQNKLLPEQQEEDENQPRRYS